MMPRMRGRPLRRGDGMALALAAALALPALASAAEPPRFPPAPQDQPPPEQAPAEQPPPAEPVPAPAPTQPPPTVAPANRERERSLPRLDIYFPEGDLDFRLSKLQNKVFYEGQVKYNFIDGDITAFLRYRYYGRVRTTQFAVFDAVAFPDIEDFTDEFDRVRGILVLQQWPHDVHHRTFTLLELDRLSNNKEALRSQNNRTNTFLRVGYQVGAGDSRSNAIVGETRARNERLFTAFREVGPGNAGFTGAITYGFDAGWGDFDYVKAELETLKRFDLTRRTFLIGRLHGGTFLYKRQISTDEELGEFDRYNIPLSEFFRLDGREYLKGVTERLRGTEQIHLTWEYFFPWFLNARHRVIKLDWQNWYWILYAGAGTVGFDREVYTRLGDYIPDAGVGFESSFQLNRKYTFFLSGVVAQALKGDGGVEARISVKSYR
jgi:hypothetical protein